MRTGADNVRFERVATAVPVAVLEFDRVFVVPAAKRRGEPGDADALWFARVAVGFFDFADHAGVHTRGPLFDRIRFTVDFPAAGDLDHKTKPAPGV